MHRNVYVYVCMYVCMYVSRKFPKVFRKTIMLRRLAPPCCTINKPRRRVPPLCCYRCVFHRVIVLRCPLMLLCYCTNAPTVALLYSLLCCDTMYICNYITIYASIYMQVSIYMQLHSYYYIYDSMLNIYDAILIYKTFTTRWTFAT